MFEPSSVAFDAAMREELGDLHVDLVVYDGDVAGRISQVIMGSQTPMHHYDRAEELGTRIRGMIKRYPDSDLLRAYLKEYNELQQMLDVAERMARE